MKFKIIKTAKKTNLTIHTIQYYYRESLLPFIQHTDSAIRYFSNNNLDYLEIINCLNIILSIFFELIK